MAEIAKITPLRGGIGTRQTQEMRETIAREMIRRIREAQKPLFPEWLGGPYEFHGLPMCDDTARLGERLAMMFAQHGAPLTVSRIGLGIEPATNPPGFHRNHNFFTMINELVRWSVIRRIWESEDRGAAQIVPAFDAADIMRNGPGDAWASGAGV